MPPKTIEVVPLLPRRAHVSAVLRNFFRDCAVEHAGSIALVEAESPRIEHETRSLFFHALAACFSNHHPFGLRPEVLGYLINHEIAITVKQHPDEYRHLFTRHAEGKDLITVRDDTLAPGRPSNWARAISLFEGELRRRVPDGILDAMLPAYTTLDEAAHVASLLAFMDTAQPYYDYKVLSLCGIPRIALFGTPEDWHLLLSSTAKLAEQFDRHLASYFARVLPILARIAGQANPGAPVDEAFWASIYKLHSASGGDVVTGWSGSFVHYTSAAHDEPVPRPDDEADVLGTAAIPTHVSTIPFRWQVGRIEIPMLFAGGVLALDDVEGFLTPGLSFAVLHARPAAGANENTEARHPRARARLNEQRPGRVRLVQLYSRPNSAGDEPVIDEATRRLTALIRAATATTAGEDGRLGFCEGCMARLDDHLLEHGHLDFTRGDLHRLAWHRAQVSRETLARIQSLEVGEATPTEDEFGTPLRQSAEHAASLLDYVGRVLAVARLMPADRRNSDAETQVSNDLDRLGQALEAARAKGAVRFVMGEIERLTQRAWSEIPTAGRQPSVIEEMHRPSAW